MQQQGRQLPPVVIQQPSSGGSGGGGGKQNNISGMTLILSVVFSAVLAWFIIVPMVAPSQAKFDQLKTELTNQITNSLQPVSSYGSRITDLENVSGNTNLTRTITDLGKKSTPDLSGYATASSLSAYIKDADLDAKLKALGYVKGGTTTTTTTGTGGTTTTDGLAIALEKSSVISTQTTTSPGDSGMSVTVTNSSGAGKNVSLVITLEPLSPSAYNIANISTYQAKSTLSGFTTYTNGTIQPNTDVSSLVSKIVWIAPNFWIENGSSKTLWLFFNVKLVPASDVVTWSLAVKPF